MLNKLNHFDTNLSSSLPLDSKIAIISYQNTKFSRIFEFLLLTIEYFQLISLNYLFYAEQASTQLKNPFQLAILYLAKTLNPGYLFTYDEQNQFVWAVLAVVLLYSAFRYLLFPFIVVRAQQGKEINPFIRNIWRWTFKVQTRVGYGIVTSFWLNAIQQVCIEGNLTIFKGEKAAVQAVFLILIIIEFFFCFILNDRYYSILPTKSLLSSKNTTTESLNLTQKFTLQILQVISQNLLATNSASRTWIFVPAYLLFSFFRTTLYFKYLPLYNIKGLLYQGLLIMILASFDIAACFQAAIYSNSSEEDLNSAITLWAIISILAIKIAYEYFTRTALELGVQDLRISPILLIQKLSIILQLKEQRRLPDNFARKYESFYLLNGAVTVNLEDSLEFCSNPSENNGYPPESKEYYYQMVVYHLESALAKLPRRNNLIKLYLAKIYGKKLKQYALAMKYLIELKKSPNRIIAQNAAGLVWTLQKTIQTESVKSNKKIDLNLYFASKTKVNEFKKNIVTQLELQDQFYQEMQEETPDLAKISGHAQTIHNYRKKIAHDASKGLANISDHYTLPMLLYAQYELLANNSIYRYLKSFKEYALKSQIYKKHFESEDLARENCFDEKTGVLLVSSQKDELGKIQFCTKSISAIYGGDDSMYVGANISTIAPLSSPYFDALFSKTQQSQKPETDSLNRPFRGYCNHKNGHIIELNFYIDVFPFLTQGLYYCIFIRQIPTVDDYILINENSMIQGATKSLMKQLGAKKALDVGVLSRELSQINEAFNFVANSTQEIPDENQNQNHNGKIGLSQTTIISNQYEKELSPQTGSKNLRKSSSNAMDLFTIFSAKGRKIKLTQFNEYESGSLRRNGRRTYTYDCKITTISTSPSVLRLVTLKEEKISGDTIIDAARSKDLSENYQSRASIKSPTVKFLKNKLSQRNDSFDDDFLLGVEDEKETGWINFQPLSEKIKEPTSPKGHEDLMTHLTGNIATTEGNLLSPISIKPRKFTLELNTENKLKAENEQKRGSILLNNGQKKAAKPDVEAKLKALGINASVSSRTSNLKLSRVSQTLDAALSSKHYSRPLKGFYLVFYLLMLGLLGSQIGLNAVLDATTNDMRLKKNILKNSQLRDYSLVTIYRVYRVILDAETGSFDSTSQATFPTPLSAFVALVKSTMTTLVKTNSDLLQNAGLVDEQLRDILFEADVRLYYSDEENEEGYVRNFTTFQATDEMISASYAVLQQTMTNITKAQTSLNFILKNSMNDLLIKSEEATETFLQSISLKVDRGLKTIKILLIIVTVLFAIVVIVFLYFIVKAYFQERLNLTALINLDMEHIKEVQTKLNEFKRFVINETPDEETDILNDYQTRYMTRSNKKFQSSRNTQRPNHNGIRRKYLFMVLKALVLLGGILAIPIVISVLASSSINSLLWQQSRLYFANGMSKTVNMAYLTYRDMYSTNASSYIRNEPVATGFQGSINDLSVLRNNFLETFLENEESYSDYVFRTILLGPPCSFIVNTTTIDFCGYMKKLQINMGLVSLLSDYERFVMQKQQEFYSSDRSFQTLINIQAEDYALFTATLREILDESAMVATRANLLFENKYEEIQSKGNEVLIICSFVLALISILIWVTIFKSLREDFNEFKSILRNFPPRLILSNFVIKTFLVKSSNYANDIEKIDL